MLLIADLNKNYMTSSILSSDSSGISGCFELGTARWAPTDHPKMEAMGGGEAGEAPSYAVEINPTAIELVPSEPCPFDAPLSLAIDFTCSADLPGAHWKLRYMVDMAHARHNLELAATDAVDYG